MNGDNKAMKQAVKFAKFFAKLTACTALLVGCEKIDSSLEKRLALQTKPPSFQDPLPQILQSESPDTLKRVILASRFEFDPHFIRDNAFAAPIRDLLLGLMAFNSQGQIEPAMAVRWATKDNKTWQFFLGNHQWSNGEAVTAMDFVASWRRLVTPENQSPFASYLVDMGVSNAKAILTKEKNVVELGVKAINAKTLEIRLEKAKPQLVQMLGHIALLPTYQGKKIEPSLWITNGDYAVEMQSPTFLRLAHRRSTAFFKQVEYQLVDENFPFEKVDLIENPIQQHNTQHIQDTQNTQNVVDLPRLCTYFYQFNFQDPRLSKQEVRRAIKAMIFAARIRGQNGLINHYVLPKTMREEKERQWSPIVIEKLLIKNGITPQNPLRLKFVYDEQGQHTDIAKQMIRVLSQSDLIRVDIHETDRQDLLKHDQQGDFHLIRSSLCANYPEPSEFLWQFHRHSPKNKNGYQNAQVDKNLEILRNHKLNKSKRAELIQETAQLLEDDVAILPLFQYQRRISVNSSLLGIDFNNASEVIYSKHLSRQPQIKDENEPTHGTTN